MHELDKRKAKWIAVNIRNIESTQKNAGVPSSKVRTLRAGKLVAPSPTAVYASI